MQPINRITNIPYAADSMIIATSCAEIRSSSAMTMYASASAYYLRPESERCI